MLTVAYRTWLALLVLPAAVGGCFLASWRSDRSAQDDVSGPVVYVERCQTCHADRVGRQYAASVHAAKGIRCGQCHTAGHHPDFAEPVQDAKCGGCHQPEFQQTLASRHFATRRLHALNGDRPARVALRRAGFRAPTGGGSQFVGDADAGELGGRLCAACHYDEHRLGLGTVQRADFCVECHGRRDEHYATGAPNRCVSCHVREGTTVMGRAISTHRFAIPGTGSAGP